MEKPLRCAEILENLKMLADWIRVKRPGEYFELVVVGGAAMAIEGFKDQTMDIDVIRPEVLPEPILNGITHIARIKRLSPGWLNTDVANMLLETKVSKILPEYFNDISQSIEVGKNMKISLIGRQALISLKLYGCGSIGSRTKAINIGSLGDIQAKFLRFFSRITIQEKNMSGFSRSWAVEG